MPIPLAAVVAAMKVGKAAANAMSPSGGSPTPNVDVPKNQKPKAEDYDQPKVEQPKPATTTDYTPDKDGMMQAGKPTPTKSNASTFSADEGKRYSGRSY